MKPSNLRAKFENLAKQGEEEAKKKAEEERERRKRQEGEEEQKARALEEQRLKKLLEQEQEDQRKLEEHKQYLEQTRTTSPQVSSNLMYEYSSLPENSGSLVPRGEEMFD